MIGTPTITETGPQLAAAIRLTIPRAEIQAVMGPGIQEAMAALQAQGHSPAGPWFTHHLKYDPAAFDFEICVPVSRPMVPVGRVACREFPAAKVVRTSYLGPYQGLAGAWAEFGAWIAANGLTTEPDFFECYVTGPESTSDPAGWRTDLIRPLTATR